MKKILILATMSLFIFACAASTDSQASTDNTTSTTKSAPVTQGNCVLGSDTVENCKVN